MILEPGCEPSRQRHVADPPALGGRHVPFPVGAFDPKLSLGQIDVAPLEGHHLPAPESRLSAEQHDQVGVVIVGHRGIDKSLVLIEVVEAGGRLRNRQQADRAGRPFDDAPLGGFLQ